MKGLDEEDQDHVGGKEGTEAQVVGRIRMLSAHEHSDQSGTVENRAGEGINRTGLTVQNLASNDKTPPSRAESGLLGAIVASHRERIALKMFHSMTGRRTDGISGSKGGVGHLFLFPRVMW